MFYWCFRFDSLRTVPREKGNSSVCSCLLSAASVTSAVCDSKLRCIVVVGCSGVIQLPISFKVCCSADHSRTEVWSRSLVFLLLDSEYSYCRMSKLFILPAALKSAKLRSLLVVYFPWRPLDRTEKDCDLRWGGAAAWCKCRKPWLSPEHRLALQLFQLHWQIHLLSRLQVSSRQHGSTDHDWRSSILLLKSQDQGPIHCRSSVLHSTMHDP